MIGRDVCVNFFYIKKKDVINNSTNFVLIAVLRSFHFFPTLKWFLGVNTELCSAFSGEMMKMKNNKCEFIIPGCQNHAQAQGFCVPSVDPTRFRVELHDWRDLWRTLNRRERPR